MICRRLKLRLKSKIVARAIGVHPNTIVYWENGRRRPSLQNYRKWCRFMARCEKA